MKRHFGFGKPPAAAAAAAAFCLAAASCGGGASSEDTGPPAPVSAAAPPAAASTDPPASGTAAAPEPTSTTAGPLPSCEGDFTSGGALASLGSARGDGVHIAGVSRFRTGDCERLEVYLTAADGSPSSALPPVEVELMADAGLLRMSFDPAVQTASITDASFSGGPFHSVYVVRGLDGRLFVDAHLSRSVEAAAEAGPSRLTVVLRSTDGHPSSTPAVSSSAVVTSPARHDGVSYPIAVAGYARNFEANVIGFTTGPDGTAGPVYFTSSADYIQTWGEFRLLIEDGPAGLVTLSAGDYDAESGGFHGVQLPLTAR